jgi:hypothetical protein
VIDGTSRYEVAVSRKAILAEIGAQLQGRWVNLIGQGAARAVQKMIVGYVHKQELGRAAGPNQINLNNGWKVLFGPEPDVAFLDADGVKRIAVEIKGSLDVAGAQTRYGEALKSLRKQLAENPRCQTIYLASCFTDAVIDQIWADGQVREWYNLTGILADDREGDRFLRRLFHTVMTPG